MVEAVVHVLDPQQHNTQQNVSAGMTSAAAAENARPMKRWYLDMALVLLGIVIVMLDNVTVQKLVEDVRAKGGTVTREPGPVKGGKSIIAFVNDPDGYMFEIIQRPSTPEPLCQVTLPVGELERSIKFYEKALGLKLLRTIDRPEYKYTIAILGYKEEDQTTILEFAYNYGVTEYTKGNVTDDVYKSADDVYKSAEAVNLVTQELGGKITRQPGPIPGLNTKITSFLDPDGWKTVLVDNEDFLKELQQ